MFSCFFLLVLSIGPSNFQLAHGANYITVCIDQPITEIYTILRKDRAPLINTPISYVK